MDVSIANYSVQYTVNCIYVYIYIAAVGGAFLYDS